MAIREHSPRRPKPGARTTPLARATDAKAKARLRMIIGGLALVLLAAAISIPLSRWGQAERYERKFTPIRELYEQWHGYLMSGDYAQAYQLMTPRYRFYHTLEDFQKEFEPFASETYAVQEEHEIGRFNEEAGIMPNVYVPLDKRLHLLFRYHQDRWQIKGRRFAEEEAAVQMLEQMFQAQPVEPVEDPET